MRELLLSVHTHFVCIEEIILFLRIINSIKTLKFASSGVLKGISVLAVQTLVLSDTENRESGKCVFYHFSESCRLRMPLNKSLLP